MSAVSVNSLLINQSLLTTSGQLLYIDGSPISASGGLTTGVADARYLSKTTGDGLIVAANSTTQIIEPFQVYCSFITGSPEILFKQSGLLPGGISLNTDYADSDHNLMVLGLNLRMNDHGIVPIVNGESAWGFLVERNYYNGETVQHEAYLTDRGSNRPWFTAYSEAVTASVVSIGVVSGISGVVTIQNPQANNFLRSGLRFKFTALGNPSGISVNTFYKVDQIYSPTTFSVKNAYIAGGVTGSSTTGTMRRGGWGSTSIKVPTVIAGFEYDSLDIVNSCLLQVANYVSAKETIVRVDNYDNQQCLIDFNFGKWRVGTDQNGGSINNFYIRNGTTADAPFQINASSRVAIGYTYALEGYTPHNTTGTLDVNGLICASSFSGVSGISSKTSKNYAILASALPSASETGLRAFVSNASGTLVWGNILTGGGSNPSPVWADGVNWRIG